MRIVADTNTFLAVALNEPERDRIIRLTAGHALVAPEVLPFEMGNSLTAMLKKRILQGDEVCKAWDALQQIPVELFRVEVRAALEIAVRFDICAYDGYFLECALRGRLPLLTLDKSMMRIATSLGIHILE